MIASNLFLKKNCIWFVTKILWTLKNFIKNYSLFCWHTFFYKVLCLLVKIKNNINNYYYLDFIFIRPNMINIK